MKIISQIMEARHLINQGGIIAYPTEAVYGLGCDPFNQQAVKRILAIKQRPFSKGLIVLIADWSQLELLVSHIESDLLVKVKETWPGAVTWVFPKAKTVHQYLSGEQDSIAIRMSAHPIARVLCADGPIVSTSANISGHNPAMDIAELMRQFPQGIDACLSGDLGGANQPSSIYDVLNGQRLR